MIRNIIFRHAAVFKNWGVNWSAKNWEGAKAPSATLYSGISDFLRLTYLFSDEVHYCILKMITTQKKRKNFSFFDFKCQLKLCLSKILKCLQLKFMFLMVCKRSKLYCKKLVFDWLACPLLDLILIFNLITVLKTLTLAVNSKKTPALLTINDVPGKKPLQGSKGSFQGIHHLKGPSNGAYLFILHCVCISGMKGEPFMIELMIMVLMKLNVMT